MQDNQSNERAFVGSLLFAPDKVLKVARNYSFAPDYFTEENSRLIFGAVLRLDKKSDTPIDLITVNEELRGKLDVSIIQKLYDNSPTAAHAEYYARQIRFAYNQKHALTAVNNATDDTSLGFAADAIKDTLPTPESTTGYSVRSWGECVEMELPEKRYFFGKLFACGQMQVIYGQGGLGKSRLGTNLARNQVLGLPFLGAEVGKPLKHLFIGSENDIHRWQMDARAMSKGLTKAQISCLDEHIHMTTLESGDDVSINLADDEALTKWKETLHSWPPDVLWVDPWGDIIQGEGFDKDVRSTLRTLKKNAAAVNPDCGIVILAHARTGTANIIQAGGFDAANFGKDSKALFSTARAVVNIAPFDASENPDLIWVPAKCNDGKRPEPLRITLDSETMTYNRVDSVDIEEWQANIKATSRHQSNRPVFDPDAVKKMFGDGALTKTELHDQIRSTGVTEQATRAGIAGMIRKEQLLEKKAGNRNQKLIGTPESFKPDKSDVEFIEFV